MAFYCLELIAQYKLQGQAGGLIGGRLSGKVTWLLGSVSYLDVWERGQYWRLISAAFLHGGIFHILMNGLVLWDMGRVCEYGSVRVSEYMDVERYSHVMHIVSNVEGRLAAGRDCFDLIRATFPAGTVSGAPKIRAMEIIDELEPVRRGPYAGLVGYFSFGGDLDSCITIRTMLVKDHQISMQVGAGIVADSIPDKEYEETLNKAGALLQAVRLAKGGLS